MFRAYCNIPWNYGLPWSAQKFPYWYSSLIFVKILIEFVKIRFYPDIVNVTEG